MHFLCKEDGLSTLTDHQMITIFVRPPPGETGAVTGGVNGTAGNLRSEMVAGSQRGPEKSADKDAQRHKYISHHQFRILREEYIPTTSALCFTREHTDLIVGN